MTCHHWHDRCKCWWWWTGSGRLSEIGRPCGAFRALRPGLEAGSIALKGPATGGCTVARAGDRDRPAVRRRWTTSIYLVVDFIRSGSSFVLFASSFFFSEPAPGSAISEPRAKQNEAIFALGHFRATFASAGFRWRSGKFSNFHATCRGPANGACRRA